MATIFPSYNPIPSTPSASSQSSLPPNYAIPVHDHVLPPGWQCKFDPKTCKYYFINDYLSSQLDFYKMGTQGSCQSSRSSSPSHTTYTSIGKYYQPFSSRYRINDATVQRISRMFPEVDESYINQLLRKHANRENKVIEILSVETSSRVSYQTSVQTQIQQTIQPDQSLLYKLNSYFPNVNQETIKRHLIKCENSEYETIKSILASLAPFNYHRHSSKQTLGTPRIKLRYLKLLYPEVDEIILFDLLYNCDQNAQYVIEKLDKMGYKRRDVQKIIEDRKLEAANRLARPKTIPIKVQPSVPPKTAEKLEVFDRLQKSFPKADRVLINMALECSQFNENQALILLNSMTPQDSEKYIKNEWQVLEIPLPNSQNISTQTGAFIECLLGTPIRNKNLTSNLTKKHDMGTWTKEDGIIVDPAKKKPIAKGPDSTNFKGPAFLDILKSYIPWKGSDSKNRKGPSIEHQKGPDFRAVIGPSGKAKGADTKNRKGPCFLNRRKKIKDSEEVNF